MLSLNIFIASLVTPTVFAWGDVGHRTVGYLAQHYLTPDASQWVDSLLANEDGFDISDAAVWPDQIKRRREYTAGWHYLDTSQDPMVQTEALMYLIHFIGDIHQPLHVENVDRGGNEIHVCFDHRCAKAENLHSIWDTDIVHKINGLKHYEKHNEEREAAQKWADSLFAEGQRSLRKECDDINNAERCAMEWAKETNAYVCSYVLANGIDWLESNDLGGEYYEGAAPIVESQIAKAGARLGAWLNALAVTSSSSSGLVIQEEL
ncbi:hypothetical protein B7463_g11726, partial [Scytalidium lignicola]